MSERKNSRGSTDGFSWTAESEKVRDRFSEDMPHSARRNGSHVHGEKRREDSVFSSAPPYGSFSDEGLFYDYRGEKESMSKPQPEYRPVSEPHRTAPPRAVRPAERGGAAPNGKGKRPAGRADTKKARPPKETSRGKSTAAQNRRPPKDEDAPRRGQKKSVQKAGSIAREYRKKQIEKASEDYRRRTKNGASEDDLRKERTRKKRRQRKLAVWLSVGFFCVIAVAAVAAFCITRGAPIEKIIIEGEKTYTEKEILAAAGIAAGDNMLTIRQKKTNETLTKALPYIAKVKIDYQLPDTLKLNITETSDKYCVVLGPHFLSIDENRKILSDAKKKLGGSVVKIEGMFPQEYTVGEKLVPADSEKPTEAPTGESESKKPDSQADEAFGRVSYNRKKFEISMKIADAVQKAGIKKCSVINVADPDKIYVVYNSRVKLYLRSDSNFEYAMKFAKKALDDPRVKSAVMSSDSSYIDLRLGSQAVFKTGELE